MITLNNLSSPKGSNKKTKELVEVKGLAGVLKPERAAQGQKARSGGGVKNWFRGWIYAFICDYQKRFL